MSGHKIQKVMVQPINLLFRFFQKKLRVQVFLFLGHRAGFICTFQIWLYDVVNVRLEGVIIGFDEYMNLVLDDVDEIHVKVSHKVWVMLTNHVIQTHFKKNIGRILLKGDNITLIQQAPAST